MRNTFIILLAAAAFVPGFVNGAESTNAAQVRAARYQREVRSALSGRGWRITQDEAGKLTAERRRPNQNGTNTFILGDDINTYARLQIDFRADGDNHTVSSARASLCYYESSRDDTVGQTVYPPFALRDPKLTQEYHEILAEADSHMSSGRRTRATTEANGAQDRNKVAVK